MPPAARVTDLHVCPFMPAGGPVAAPCDPRVLIGHMPAARVGDVATCAGPPDVIVAGEPTVLIGYRPAARLGDPTARGGTITMGCPNVLIGTSAQARTLERAAQEGTPLCEPCA
ncbi:PAAR domain-containing protein [Polyangium jinanense]|uniref:PAAR domain-containing protein n=1 Tax=Polyangium jinanense TaxID=2829994 RepID=A0A9X3XDK1_9BACT|nr:PAAR domain-containing protein [Polyangium jinanense]MDC3961940.1 PAAR domain-containing protein [Polyangium jinanense]MDC3988659.1 PAAR domain-containing protein [Polyangium jinanense]